MLINHSVVLPEINELVFKINDLTIHTYQFMRLYILKCFNQKQALPEINKTFILYCIKTLGIRDNRGKKPANGTLFNMLAEFYDEEYQPLLNHEKTQLLNTTKLVPYLAIQILTAYTNNLQEHFIQHFLRFINKTTTKITEDKAILFQFKKQLLTLDPNTPDLFEDWKIKHLAKILPPNIKKSVNYDVKVQPFAYLPGMLYMNSVLETQGSKLFQPLPLRTNIVPKHLTLDTACIVSLFCPTITVKGKQIKKGALLKNIKEYQHEIWAKFLNLDLKIFRKKGYQFHHQIQTDGISCCLLFARDDLQDKKWGNKIASMPEQEFYSIEELPKDTLQELKLRNIVGCDPGKRNLVYMVDQEGKKLRYTAPQRKIESKAKCNQRILLAEKKKNRISEYEACLSAENAGSVDYQKFRSYLGIKSELNFHTSEFYQRDTWRKMKFRQYSYGRKSLDKFLNKIQETFGSNILIGYGNWSRSTQMKNFMPTMNKGLRKAIHKKYDTVTINECNTSKKCCKCHHDLEYYKDMEGQKVFRLLKCSNCVRPQVKQTVFRSRDVNSAINIRNLTTHWIKYQKRPLIFQISSATRPTKSQD